MSQIDELRQIIVGGSAEQLAELSNRIEDLEHRTNDVAEVLSPAIDKEVSQGGERLVASLTKPVTLGLKRAVRSEPEEYAEILYPVMAPSIRRAITQALSSLLLTINRSVESATTFSGLGNRFRSWRTGIPYAELALRESLVYKVEHAYLIHRQTGLLVEDVSDSDSETLDSDAIAAMFSAIQAFVQDSFSTGNDARLTDLKVGKHNVWVAHGQQLMLACVITGDAPEAFKSNIYDTLDRIRTTYSVAIADFQGNNTDFLGVDSLMQPLLQIELKDIDENQKVKQKSGIPIWLWLLLFCGLVYFGYQWAQKKEKVSNVEHLLRGQPGIATTHVYWQDDQIVVKGLRDPDAEIPYAKLESYGISEGLLSLQTIPFRSLEIEMELQRFNKELDLPESVYLSERNEKIYLYGKAPIAWLEVNDTRIRQLAADGRMVISDLGASIESVSEMVRQVLPENEWKGLKMTTIAQDKHTIVLIGGSLRQQSANVLRALFAGSHWVRIGAPLATKQFVEKN